MGLFACLGMASLFAFYAFHEPWFGGLSFLAFYLVFRKKSPRIESYSVIIGFFFFLLWFGYHFQKDDGPERPLNTRVLLDIRLAEQPSFDGDRMTAVARDGRGKVLIRYRIPSFTEKKLLETRLAPGTSCRISGHFESPRGPTNPNAFDYRIYLAARKIHHLLIVDSIHSCRQEKPTVTEKILSLRQKGLEKIRAHVPPASAPFVNALLFGEQEGMDPDVDLAYRRLGLTHLLAISGLHVTFLTAACFRFFLRMGVLREHARSLLLCLLPIYALLAGLGPSVVRSVLMTWFLLFFSGRKWSLSPFDALCLTFVSSLIFNPFLLYHAGFQLSYVVTAFLLLSGKIFRRCRNGVTLGICGSFVSQLASLPILLHHFYEFSPLSILANLPFVPLYSFVILPLSVLVFFLLHVIPGFAGPLIFLLDFLISFMNGIALRVAQIPGISWTLGKTPGGFLPLFYASFTLALFWWENRRDKWRRIFLIILPLLMQLFLTKWSPVGEVTVLDVGQGDSLYIRLPFNRGHYLIDTGGLFRLPEEPWKKGQDPFDPGEDVVVPFLKSRGVQTIDKLILTHGDADHIGSAASLFAHFRVREVISGDTTEKKELEKKVLKIAQLHGARIRLVSEGMGWTVAGQRFIVLNPKKGAPAQNESSIVLYASIGGLDWFFAGDLEKEGERRIMEAYPHLTVDVLKVAHHGSRMSTSDSFLDYLRPEVALISAGKNNRFGHPHPEVVERLENRGVAIFRTDSHGAITYRFLFSSGTLSTMGKGPSRLFFFRIN